MGHKEGEIERGNRKKANRKKKVIQRRKDYQRKTKGQRQRERNHTVLRYLHKSTFLDKTGKQHKNLPSLDKIYVWKYGNNPSCFFLLLDMLDIPYTM